MLSIPYTSYLSSLGSINVLALTLLLDIPTRIPPPLMLLYTQYYCLLTPPLILKHLYHSIFTTLHIPTCANIKAFLISSSKISSKLSLSWHPPPVTLYLSYLHLLNINIYIDIDISIDVGLYFLLLLHLSCLRGGFTLPYYGLAFLIRNTRQLTLSAYPLLKKHHLPIPDVI